ncbi:ankyrin repeat domain-containing protein [Spongiivirga citrea]|uniref:Ankyrin repeat domain-containing protein n=1 Tax=Spongiivirga citrea TaxID=1481457 RepID=A0A6M0CKT5_9FLAO|nr:ankyrin repeat domain-containing protein [Spongiivirga citrea]NER18518.1 ankyrin repeat domain-containing protein [Spongiivirga citrea]
MVNLRGGDWKEMLKAAEQGNLELVKAYVRMGIDINYVHPEELTTPLIESARNGNFEIVKFLLENGADCTIIDGYGGFSAIESAKLHGHTEIVAMIEKHNL